VHPVVVSVPTPWGSIPLYAYGIALGAGLVVSWYVALAAARRLGSDGDEVARPFLAALLGATIAGVLGDAIVEGMRGTDGAFALHGGAFSGPFALVGAVTAGTLGARRAGGDPWRLADVAAPCLGVLYAANAVGHYLHGSAFGRLLSSGAPGFLRALGTFPRWELPGDRIGSPAYVHHLLAFPEEMFGRAAESMPVHPVQLYDALLGAAVAMIAYHRVRPETPQRRVFPLAAGAIGSGHLFLDGVRHLPPGAPELGLYGSQWLMVAVVASSLAVVVVDVLRARFASGPRERA
jgi:phosphatidylglycerol---prolipoprotein diacylglyceryl transferase